MSVELTDSQIARLLAERKILPADFDTRIRKRVPRLRHERCEVDVMGQSGHRYRIIVRANSLNHMDFSAILGYRLPDTMRIFRLRRYNGRSHQHVNRIEGVAFRAFHIHKATERYQVLGAREDTYAEPTDRFSTLEGAIRCLLLDAHCEPPVDKKQAELWFGGGNDGPA